MIAFGITVSLIWTGVTVAGVECLLDPEDDVTIWPVALAGEIALGSWINVVTLIAAK